MTFQPIVVPDHLPVELSEEVGGMPLTSAERHAIAILRLVPPGYYPVADLADFLGLAGGLNSALTATGPAISALEQLRMSMGLLLRLFDGGWLERPAGFFEPVLVDQDRLKPLLDMIEAAS